MKKVMQNVFYPGAFSTEQQQQIMRSELWPLISGFHFKRGGTLFLSSVSRVNSQGLPTLAIMCVRDGWPVLKLTKPSGSTKYSVVVLGHSAASFGDLCIESDKIPYILKRANEPVRRVRRNKKLPLYSTLNQRIGALTGTTIAQSTIYGHIEYMVRMFSRTKRLPPTRLEMSDATRWSTVKALMESTALDSLPSEVRTEVNNLYGQITRREEMLTTVFDDIEFMFPPDGHKWLLCYMDDYGWVVSKIRCHELANCAKSYIMHGAMPDVLPSHVQIVEPFTFYPSLDKMPQEHLAVLIPRLTFAKTNREAYPGNSAAWDADKFVCTNDLVQDRIASLTYNATQYHYIMVDA